MNDALDEDAPALARTAATVVDVLNDATADSEVPRSDGLRDTEAVPAALSTLGDGLQETTTHLTRYLDEQLRADRLAPAAGSSQAPSAAVDAAADVLGQVRATAVHLSALLTQAELALLALATRPSAQEL